MKFLCISCNTQMKLIKTDSSVTPDSQGSLSLRYECPECLAEIAMLTNSFETQLVTSLGVEIGGKTIGRHSESESSIEDHPEGSATPTCPFSATARTALAQSPENKDSEHLPRSETGDGIQWTAPAQVRLQNIPEFVRPMAIQGIEKFALDNGFALVDEKCLDQAKEEFGM